MFCWLDGWSALRCGRSPYLTRFLGKLLYNVSPHDPLVFASALALMTITAISACLLPAWRASRTDPARILRD